MFIGHMFRNRAPALLPGGEHSPPLVQPARVPPSRKGRALKPVGRGPGNVRLERPHRTPTYGRLLPARGNVRTSACPARLFGDDRGEHYAACAGLGKQWMSVGSAGSARQAGPARSIRDCRGTADIPLHGTDVAAPVSTITEGDVDHACCRASRCQPAHAEASPIPAYSPRDDGDRIAASAGRFGIGVPAGRHAADNDRAGLDPAHGPPADVLRRLPPAARESIAASNDRQGQADGTVFAYNPSACGGRPRHR